MGYAKAQGLGSCKSWTAQSKNLPVSEYDNDSRCFAVVEVINTPKDEKQFFREDITPIGKSVVRRIPDIDRLIIRGIVIVKAGLIETTWKDPKIPRYNIRDDIRVVELGKQKLYSY